MTRQWGLGKNHSFPAPMPLSIGWFKGSLTLSLVLLWSSRRNRFPDFEAEFEWRREEFSGNWYYCPALNMEGWLCPALFKYFVSAPKKIYAQFRPKASNGGT